MRPSKVLEIDQTEKPFADGSYHGVGNVQSLQVMKMISLLGNFLQTRV
jgi:hypothetical protein